MMPAYNGHCVTCPPPALPTTEFRSRQWARLRDIPGQSWDELFDPSYPFTRHAFLSALEENACVGGRSGWEPCHLVLEDSGGRLLAAMPLYRKRHGYGEFVFDGSWARAAQQLGLPYYPKLLNAIPFTPVSGPRMGARSDDARRLLLEEAQKLWGESGCSSFHSLFLDPADSAALNARGALERNDIQFEWRNRGYRTFADFLARLTHDKRKKILRERRRVAEAGLRFEWRRGGELDENEWARVYALYGNTYEERGQPPYLTLAFFLDYGRAPETKLRLILAYAGDNLVAVAITLASDHTLYGRHWGCAGKYHSLHFETCYYQGIELCIREGLSRFDAGAQGEHKLARGFDPVLTRSAHRLADVRLHHAVGGYLQRERPAIAQQRELLALHTAYRTETEGVENQDG